MSAGTRPRVLVTRPAREAERWVNDLQARGLDAQALPLIAIGPAPDAAPVQAAWHRLVEGDRGGYAAVMFVSANAVHHFFELKPVNVGSSWSSFAIDSRAWSPGPGTTAALLAAGVPAASIDAPAADAGQFDSESLWARVAPQVGPGRRVLIVRGADAGGRSSGRDWLAQQIVAAGGQVDVFAAYGRCAPALGAAERERAAQAAGDGTVWLFSSSEAIAHLRAALPEQDWGAARAVATHPRIAQAARAAGFGAVRASRPTLDGVVASIESGHE